MILTDSVEAYESLKNADGQEDMSPQVILLMAGVFRSQLLHNSEWAARA